MVHVELMSTKLASFTLRWILFFIWYFSLPYIEATIRESLRCDTLVPSGLVHKAIADTTIMGYDIPKVRCHWNFLQILSYLKWNEIKYDNLKFPP